MNIIEPITYHMLQGSPGLDAWASGVFATNRRNTFAPQNRSTKVAGVTMIDMSSGSFSMFPERSRRTAGPQCCLSLAA